MLKKIFANASMLLFICVPIIGYIAVLVFMFSVEVLRNNLGPFLPYSSYLQNLEIIFTLLYAVFFLFLPFGLVGYFWAKNFINKINFTAYFVIFAFLIYALFCLNLAFVLSGWDYSNEYFKIIAFLSPLFIIPIYKSMHEFEPIYAFLIQVVPYGLLSTGVILALWKKGLLKLIKPMKILISVLFVLMLAAILQWLYRNSLYITDSVKELEGIMEKAPYDSNIVLRGEPTLKFEDNFPIIDGATALCPIFQTASRTIYFVKNQHYYINCSTTPYAYEHLIEGRVELIFTAAPSNEQLQMAKDKGIELVLTPIGKEAFVFLTNKENPVDSLSIQNIRDIYSGKITNWHKFGGENEKILAFQRNEGSGSQTAMEKYVMKDLAFKEPLREKFHTMGGMVDGVANYRNAKNAIGYSFRYYASAMKSNENIKFLNIEGIEPSIENIRSNAYPFTVEFYIVSTQNISQNAQKLIDWFLSEQGQALIEDTGYVPIREF